MAQSRSQVTTLPRVDEQARDPQGGAQDAGSVAQPDRPPGQVPRRDVKDNGEDSGDDEDVQMVPHAPRVPLRNDGGGADGVPEPVGELADVVDQERARGRDDPQPGQRGQVLLRVLMRTS